MEDVATTSGRTWTERLAELKACPWYWGDLPWRLAERLLLLCEDGWFLIRDSRSESHLFTVTYRHQEKVFHTRVGMCGQFAHLGRPLSFERSESVVDLLEKAIQSSCSGERHMLLYRRGGEAEATEVRIRHPLSRLAVLPRLQYLCRLQIRRSYSTRALPQLLVSPTMSDYIADPKYLLPNIDEAVEILERRKHALL